MACLAITGAMSTTPQPALEALLNLPTLDSYIIAEARNTAYRMKHRITDSQLRTGHSCALTDLYKYKPILNAPNDFMKTRYIFKRNYQINIPNRADWGNGTAKVNYLSHVYFADASKNNISSAYGVHMVNEGIDLMGQCGEYADITQAEIIAIEICCIDAIKQAKRGKISIYSDSIGALNAIKNYRIDSNLILECHNLLQELAIGNEVTLTWIPRNTHTERNFS